MTNRHSFGPIPVKEGQILPIIIESIGSKGDGIGKVDGYVVMIPGGQIGSKYFVKITAVRGKVSFGQIMD